MTSRPSPSRPLPPGGEVQESVVPTLRVMRLQSPELHTTLNSSLDGQPLLHNALCLPDSLEVLVGETFTAYLGVLNVSPHVPIRRLSVAAHLQTPSQRWQLPSPLETGSNGVDVPVGSAVDAIVSHAIEEAGQHILRVEVSYAGIEGGIKTFRKFYRFQVVNPLQITSQTVRAGDNVCFVSLSVEYNPKMDAATTTAAAAGANNKNSIVVSEVDFSPTQGLTAQRLGNTSPVQCAQPQTAAQLLDVSGYLAPGSVMRYLFQVTARDQSLRGIAAGDALGQAVFTWRKSMGETGRIHAHVVCPAHWPPLASPDFVVHRSGLSVDVAAAADNRTRNPNNRSNLSLQLPVTVEPIDPPSTMILNQPAGVEFYIVNHSDRPMTLQLQFRLSDMSSELAVCGPSFVSLGSVPGHGGSAVTLVRFLPLATGLLRVQGCWVVDLASDQEIKQPPLLNVYVEPPSTSGEREEATKRLGSGNPVTVNN